MIGVAWIANRIVVDALIALATGLFALWIVTVAVRVARAMFGQVRFSFRSCPVAERLFLLLLAVLVCKFGGGKGGGSDALRSAGMRGAGVAVCALSDEVDGCTGSETGRFFRIGAFALVSNRVEIGAEWSAGYFATGSVVNLFGRFGALTNEGILVDSITVDGLSVSGTVFGVTLDEPMANAAFFRLSSPCDADGDGLLDWFEMGEFGSNPNNPDSDGDGFPDSAEYVLGLDPVGSVASRVEEYSGNVSACWLTEAFAADSTNGLSGPVFCREVDLPRNGTFTQYFLASDPLWPSSVDASGFEVMYFDDNGHTGTVDAAGLSGGVRLSGLAENVNSVTIVFAAASNGLYSASGLHVVSYRPEIVFSGAQEIVANGRSASGGAVVVIGLSTDVYLDYAGRPSSEPISEEERLANPFAGMSGLSYNPASGRLYAEHPGVYALPDGRRLIFLDPSITFGSGHHYLGDRVRYDETNGYSRDSSYPIDSECLCTAWSEGYWNSEGCSCTPEVRTGLESYGGSSIIETDVVSMIAGMATGVVRVMGREVWRGSADHLCDPLGGWAWTTAEVLSGDPCGSCPAGCKDGDCDGLEGPSLGSVRFRIPLGNPEAEHVSGFLYFNRDEPFTVRAGDLILRARPDASVEDVPLANGGRIVACYDNRGRWVSISNTLNGVGITVLDSNGELEHVWEISTVGGRMRFRKISRIGNVMSDLSYAQRGGTWTETDNISGLSTDLTRVGSLNQAGGEMVERVVSDGGTVVSHEVVDLRLFGEGSDAVVREVERRELGAGGRWKTSRANYWRDDSHPRRNGALKLEWGDDRAWRYCDYDAEGRLVFRLDQRNGSEPVPTDEVWSMSNLPSVEAFATVFDYAPLSGDDRHENDTDKVRTESRYVVRDDGTAVLIGRTWRKYVHGWDDYGDTVEVTTIHAASPTSGVDDAANAVTVETRYDDESPYVPYVMRGELCSRIESDGVETRWPSWYDDGGIRTEERRYLNGVEAETYRVTVRDETYGNLLYEATALTADGTEFDWKRHVYDEKNRLILTQYADGSSETNAYSCCRLLWTVDRTGAKTLRSATTGTDRLYYAEEEVSLAELPHDELTPEGWWTIYYRDGFRATLHFFDALGRETNVCVKSAHQPGKFVNPNYRWAKAEQERITRTTYPDGVSDYAVTVDASGRTVTVLRDESSSSETVETVECDRGTDVPTSTTELEMVRGGGTFERRTTADGRWTLSSRFDEYDAEGRRVACDIGESSDCGIVTNRIDRYDFLGRIVSSETSQAAVSNVYLGASDRVLSTVDLVSGRVATNLFNEIGEQVGEASCGVENRSVVSYAVVSDELWRVSSDVVSSGTTTTSCSTVRTRLTGLSDALRAETVREEDGVAVERQVSSFDATTKVLTTTVFSSESGETVTRSMFGLETERDAPTGQYRNVFDPWGRVFIVRRTRSDGAGLDYYRAMDSDAHDREICRYDMVSDNPDSAYRRWSGYDCRGNLVAVTNDLKDVVSYAYDGENRLVEESGDAYRVRYGYDTAGRRTSLETTRDGAAFDRTGWTYDPVTGNCLAKTYADGSQVAYSYTPDGLPLRTTAPTGHWTENVYDANRCLVGVQSDDASCRSTIANDVFGRPVSAVSSAASYDYRLSGRGVATNEEATVGSAAFALRRALDPFGRIAGIAASGSAATSISYSGCGQIAAISNADALVEYSYDILKTDIGYTLTLANGRTFSRILTRPLRHHDEQISSVANITGASTNVYDYTYDRLYRPTARNADRFAYNRRGEVVSATVAGEASAYAYDGIGNFTAVIGGAVTNTYAANELNQYEEVASGDTILEPTYTSNGELASFGPWTYAYDALSRLTEVRSNGVLVASNFYDHQGRRVRLVTPEASHTFFYDGWNVILELVDHGGVTDRIEYYWGKDISGSLQGAGGVGGLLYLKRNGAIYVPFYDAYGNVMEYRAADGSLAAAYVYDAFGRTVSQTGPLADVFRYRYSTKSYDAATGLYYYGKRFYSPELRRWINRDPIDVDGGLNLYAVCENNVVSFCDALGERISIEENPSIVQDVIGGKARAHLSRGFNVKFDCTFVGELKIDGSAYRKLYILTPGHDRWNKRFEQYDEHWGAGRNSTQEWQAAYAHEMDHWNSYNALFAFLHMVNEFDGTLLCTKCNEMKEELNKQYNVLFTQAIMRSSKYDSNDYNYGGAYPK